MAKENFVLVNLNDSETKQLAQVITNDTSRKILNYLAGIKDASESQVAKVLNVPISTVHYNLQALVKAKLVNIDEFHYSAKGKEVNHYSIANKYVIIAPKQAPESLIQKLKKILPIVLIGGAISIGLQLWQTLRKSVKEAAISSNEMLMQAPEKAMIKSGEITEGLRIAADNAIAEEIAADGARIAADAFNSTPLDPVQCINQTFIPPQSCPEPSLALWFFIGFIIAVLLFILIQLLIHRNATRE